MKVISERFERKIPTFLAYLDVWNDTPMSDCKYTTHNFVENSELHHIKRYEYKEITK